MKTNLALLLAVLLPIVAQAADDLSAALQKGLFEEEANQNLPAAIQAYQSLLTASDEQRKLAATALFRLGECYRKLGQTNDAVAQYQRVIRDFTDQTTLAILSRQNLRGLGADAVSTPKPDQIQPTLSAEAEELARTERILVQLEGRDLSQVRRLLPTLVPDTDFERYDRMLTEAQEKIENCRVGKLNCTDEQGEKWAQTADQYNSRLQQRAAEVKRMLQDRIANLRAQVKKQTAEAAPPVSAVVSDQSAAAGRKAEAAQAVALWKQLEPLSRRELVRILPTVAPDALLTSLLEQLAVAERKYAELEVTFAKDHPSLKAAQASLKHLEQQIDDRVEGIMKGLVIKAAALKQQVGRGSVEP